MPETTIDMIHGEKTAIWYSSYPSVIKQMKEYVMLNLRKINGINKKEFKARYKVDLCDIFDYHELLLQGLIKEENDFVFIQNEYLYVSNEVILKFLDKYKLLNKS